MAGAAVGGPGHKALHVLEGHATAINAVAVLPDGTVVTAGNDRVIRVWDLSSEACVGELCGHTDSVHALAVLPDARLASSDSTGSVIFWDPVSQERLATCEVGGHLRSLSCG